MIIENNLKSLQKVMLGMHPMKNFRLFDLKLIMINAIENVNIKRRLNRQQGKHLLRSKINKCKLTQLLIKMMRTLQRVRKPSASQDEKPKTCINFQFKLLGLMTMVNSDFNIVSTSWYHNPMDLVEGYAHDFNSL